MALTAALFAAAPLASAQAPSGAQTVTMAGTKSPPEDWARWQLSQQPFPPRNFNLFNPQIYPGAAPTVPAQTPPTESQILRQLKETFAERFHGNRLKVKAALALYDDPVLRQKVPAPNLRAAAIVLKGTLADSSITAIKNGPFTSVVFSPALPGSSLAQVSVGPDGKPQILFNDRYKNEDFRHLASAMAHETLHQDPAVTATEEFINSSVESLVAAQLYLEDPKLATQGTQLARRNNSLLLIRINDRDTHGNLRLLTANGPNITPGGGPIATYAAAFGYTLQGQSTPGNPQLKSMVFKVTRGYVSVFDDATVRLLDARQYIFSPREVVRLARILQLEIPCPSGWPATYSAQPLSTPRC